ncbi:MAG: hypothetical protein ACRCXT_15430 [Paraclostridium sp.]
MLKEFLVNDILNCSVAINKEQADTLYKHIENEEEILLNFKNVHTVSRRFIFELLGETGKYKSNVVITGLEPSREKRIKELLHDFKVMNL